MRTSIGYPRVALLVPKFGKTVVQRNRLKRRLRELARQHLLPQPSSCDILLRPRPDAYDAPFERLREEITLVASQLTP